MTTFSSLYPSSDVALEDPRICTVVPNLFVTTLFAATVVPKFAPYFMPVSVTLPITASDVFLRSDTLTAACGVSVLALSNFSKYVASSLGVPSALVTFAPSIADPTLFRIVSPAFVSFAAD